MTVQIISCLELLFIQQLKQLLSYTIICLQLKLYVNSLVDILTYHSSSLTITVAYERYCYFKCQTNSSFSSKEEPLTL